MSSDSPAVVWPPPNKRLERSGGQPGCFMRVAVVAGVSAEGNCPENAERTLIGQ
jgi:hypothetical protein